MKQLTQSLLGFDRLFRSIRNTLSVALARDHGKVSANRAGAAGKKLDTAVSQSLSAVADRISAENVRHLLVIGDAAFANSVRDLALKTDIMWASSDIDDVMNGAAVIDSRLFATADAVICGGNNVAVNYRLSVTRMAEIDASKPVHWAAENWEFCAGTLPVPVQADDAEALLYNHFRQFFGIKDPIQFAIEIYHGTDCKRFYRILKPDESISLKLSDYFAERDKTAAIKVFASHPILTRGRHYRLRVCADIFWQNSLTTLHGLHEFGRSPERRFEFRLPARIAAKGKVVLTIPNYGRDMVENDAVTVYAGGNATERPRNPQAYLEEADIDGQNLGSSRYIGWCYRGYGGSSWFAFHPRSGPEGRSNIAGNHHASVPIDDLQLKRPKAEEAALLVGLRDLDFMVEPHLLPVTGPKDSVRFGLDFDGANPVFSDYLLYSYDKFGVFIERTSYHHTRTWPLFADELPCVQSNARIALVAVTPDWARVHFTRKGSKLQGNLVVRHTASGDWDLTEFQDSWRNVSLAVPGMAHFTGPNGPVLGRTNLFARARHGGGDRTAVLAVHGSGRVHYQSNAKLEIAVLNRAGARRAFEVDLPAFTWRLFWLDEGIDDLAFFLGDARTGPLLVVSQDADINCQILTVTADQAVSLQHMWGY